MVPTDLVGAFRVEWGQLRSRSMSRGGSSLRPVGSGIVWPLLLVVGLVLFLGVDYDGDPRTDNGPAVVLTAGATSCRGDREEAEISLPCSPVRSDAGRRVWRRACRQQLRERSVWYRHTHPVRGP